MIFARLRLFLSDQKGSIAVTSAFAVSALLSFGALALEGGNLYVDKRQQQSATDLAALAAASFLSSSDTTSATSAATTAAQANGFASSAIAKVEFGTYASNPALSAAQRFTPTTGGTPNAVRVTMRQQQPYIFGALIASASSSSTGTQGSSANTATIQTQSVAVARSVAAFQMGTGLASLNGGILNSVLGSLIGSSLSLQLMDYQTLASTNVNLFTFSNALASRVGVTTGTFNTLASGSVSLPNALRALSDSVSSSQASAALASIVAAVGTQTSALQIGSLVGYGNYGTLAVGTVPSQTATISALGMISALLQAANGTHQVATALSVAAPGIIAASLSIAIGEPVAGASLIALGPAGTTITTAQTRLLLSLQLVGPPGASVLNLPIAISLASGTATLNNVQCSNGDVTTSTVQLGVLPGLANAWVGNVSTTALNTMSTPLSPTSATLVNILGLASITGQGSASIANTSATTVPFSYADILAGTSKTVSTSDFIAPLLSNLFTNTSLSIWLLGYSAASTAALNTAILQTLATDVTPIDSILASVLVALGVSVGNATVWVSGVQCGQGALVN